MWDSNSEEFGLLSGCFDIENEEDVVRNHTREEYYSEEARQKASGRYCTTSASDSMTIVHHGHSDIEVSLLPSSIYQSRFSCSSSESSSFSSELDSVSSGSYSSDSFSEVDRVVAEIQQTSKLLCSHQNIDSQRHNDSDYVKELLEVQNRMQKWLLVGEDIVERIEEEIRQLDAEQDPSHFLKSDSLVVPNFFSLC